MDLEYVQPATTTYHDWVGTAAAENSVLEKSGDLYKLAGLDHDRWSIVAIDMVAFSHGDPSSWDVRVYAVDNVKHEIKTYEDMKALEARRGSLPVVDVLLHEVDLEDIIRCMKVVHFQLRSHGWESLDRVSRADHPPQD